MRIIFTSFFKGQIIKQFYANSIVFKIQNIAERFKFEFDSPEFEKCAPKSLRN